MFTKDKISLTGTRMSSLTGVRAIMKDIIETLSAGGEFFNLSAGNPVVLPEVASMWRDLSNEVINSSEYAQIIGRYGSSKGYQPLVDAVVQEFNQRYNLSITERNVVITPGSQSLFFFGTNIFSGAFKDGTTRKILLPLLPDYTGYGGVTLTEGCVIGKAPRIRENDAKHSFKYELDLESFSIGSDIGAMIVSRPNNPSGNVLSGEEILFLQDAAIKAGIPLFVDSAYGDPFPGLAFTECQPIFGENIIHSMTLSKAGLPGERIGIVIAEESIIEAIESFMTNACIHASRFGQALTSAALKSQRLIEVCREVINPYYRNKFSLITSAIHEYLPASIPWYLHEGEGGMFAWLWCKELPVSDWDLYQRLKKLRVITVPGSTFFPGLQGSWKPAHECIRLSLTASEHDTVEAVKLIARALKEIY